MENKVKENTQPGQAKPVSKTANIIRWVIGVLAVLGLIAIFVAMWLQR